jgi:hypothetical protein
MLINGTYIEEQCKKLLQKNISFEIKNKTIKSGKLILFNQRNFHIVFYIFLNKQKKESFETPIPFNIEYHPEDNLMFFDYRIKTLSKMFQDSEPFLSLYTPKVAKSKFFDTILTINGK